MRPSVAYCSVGREANSVKRLVGLQSRGHMGWQSALLGVRSQKHLACPQHVVRRRRDLTADKVDLPR